MLYRYNLLLYGTSSKCLISDIRFTSYLIVFICFYMVNLDNARLFQRYFDSYKSAMKMPVLWNVLQSDITFFSSHKFLEYNQL